MIHTNPSMNTKALIAILALVAITLTAADTTGSAIGTFTRHGQMHTYPQSMSFAIAGNCRNGTAMEIAAGTVRDNGTTPAVLSDIQHAIDGENLHFAVLLGDGVNRGTKRQWRRLQQKLTPLQQTPIDGGTGLFSILPVVGDHEHISDDKLERWGSMFPGAGTPIGYGRVASWYHFDIVSAQHRWRMIVLDSGKDALGSRWDEQVAWLEQAVEESFDSLIVFVHDPVADLAGRTETPPNTNTSQLLSIIDMAVSPMKQRGVFFAGGHVNQVMLPDGPRGTLHLGAGGCGGVTQPLRRWGSGPQGSGLRLEPMFDLSLVGELQVWAEDHDIDEARLEEAQGSGAYEGFTAVISPKVWATTGWWTAQLDGPNVQLGFRHRTPDGSFVTRYRIGYTPHNGWKSI